MTLGTHKSLPNARWLSIFCLLVLFTSTFNIFAASVLPLPTPEQTAKALRKQAAKFVKKGMFDDAEKALVSAIEKEPANTDIRLELAVVYLKTARLTEAYKVAFPIAEADPKNALAYAIVGTVVLGAGHFDQARLILNTALTLNKREALAWASLGRLEFYENNVDKSLEYLREAVYRDRSEPDYLFSLGQVAARAENFREAAATYRKFLDISPDEDKDRRDRIVGLINFLDYIAQKPSLYDSDGEDATSVPMTLVNQRPIVTVKLNGRDEPQNFVLDTGSGISVISERTAKEFGIEPVTHGGLGRGIGGDGNFDIIFGFVKEMTIGDVRIRNIPVCIRRFHSGSDRVDGYIGLSLISKFETTVDYGAGKFELKKMAPVAKGGDPTPSAVNDELSLPLRLTSSGFLSGEVLLSGHDEPLNFIVDTGASTTVLAKQLMDENAFREIEQQGTVHVFGAAGVSYGVASYILPSVKFGPNVQNDVSAIAIDLDIINQTSGYRQSGILGGNFLSKYKVTFDFQRSKVRLSPIVSEVTVDPAPLIQ